jgi:hypothetical protein
LSNKPEAPKMRKRMRAVPGLMNDLPYPAKSTIAIKKAIAKQMAAVRLRSIIIIQWVESTKKLIKSIILSPKF